MDRVGFYFGVLMVMGSVFLLVAYFIEAILPEISDYRWRRRARKILEESREESE